MRFKLFGNLLQEISLNEGMHLMTMNYGCQARYITQQQRSSRVPVSILFLNAWHRSTAAIENSNAKVSPVNLLKQLSDQTHPRLQVAGPAYRDLEMKQCRFRPCPVWKNTLQVSFEWFLLHLTRLLTDIKLGLLPRRARSVRHNIYIYILHIYIYIHIHIQELCSPPPPVGGWGG